MTVLIRLILTLLLALPLAPDAIHAQTNDESSTGESTLFRTRPATTAEDSSESATPPSETEAAESTADTSDPQGAEDADSEPPAESTEADTTEPEETAAESPPPEMESAETATTESDSGEQTATVTVDTGNVRAEPALTAELVARIKEGDAVRVLAEEGDWFQIRTSDDAEGWAHKGLFGEAELPGRGADGLRPGDDLRVTTGTGNLRKEPTMDAEVVERLSGGETVTVTAVQKDWFKVRNAEGVEGWTHWTLYRQPKAATLEAIRIERSRTGEEKVHFIYDGKAPPRVFLLDTEHPRLVCDFENTALGNDIPEETAVSGRLIWQIRAARRGPLRTAARVVMDLAPEKIYEFQHFFVEEQLYTLIVAGE
ncbi:MAG: SH3 domain-containing protein [Desulfococcaceae bacterium]